MSVTKEYINETGSRPTNFILTKDGDNSFKPIKKTIVCGSSGKKVFNELLWGTYTLTEVCAPGYRPGGFKKSADQTGATDGAVLYERQIQLPYEVREEEGLQLILDYELTVSNIENPAAIQIEKKWNKGHHQPGETPEF